MILDDLSHLAKDGGKKASQEYIPMVLELLVGNFWITSKEDLFSKNESPGQQNSNGIVLKREQRTKHAFRSAMRMMLRKAT